MSDHDQSPVERAIKVRADATERQRRSRSQRDEARQTAAMMPNPNGFVVPPMPMRLRELRRWIASGHDMYSRREITPFELTEMRRSMSILLDSFKAQAHVTQSRAAVRQAEATERMAEVLSSLEHGGAAVALLARLRELPGESRPLPFRRRVAALPNAPPPEGA